MSATVSRLQYLIFIITTAGYNKEWPCYLYRKVCLDILSGIKKQPDTFVMIFTLDKDDDWKDERNWPKANPNYGISVEPDNMRQQFTKAINRGGRAEVTFKTKNLNVWVDAPETWISDEKVVASNHGITLDDLKGQPVMVVLTWHRILISMLLTFTFQISKGGRCCSVTFGCPKVKLLSVKIGLIIASGLKKVGCT